MGKMCIRDSSVTAHSPKDSIDIIKTVMDNYTSISYYTVGTTVLDVLDVYKRQD